MLERSFESEPIGGQVNITVDEVDQRQLSLYGFGIKSPIKGIKLSSDTLTGEQVQRLEKSN